MRAVPRLCTLKSTIEDDDRDRHDVRPKHRRRDLEAFDRAEHGDGRRDHAVAVEQRRAEQSDEHEHVLADRRPFSSAA